MTKPIDVEVVKSEVIRELSDLGLNPPISDESNPFVRISGIKPVIPEARAAWLALVPERFRTK